MDEPGGAPVGAPASLKSYSRPRLRIYGKVKDLTAGGSINEVEMSIKFKYYMIRP